MVKWIALSMIIILFLLGNYIPLDLVEAIEFYGTKIIPSQPILGQIVFLIIIIFTIFSKEIINLYKTHSGKVSLKNKF